MNKNGLLIILLLGTYSCFENRAKSTLKADILARPEENIVLTPVDSPQKPQITPINEPETETEPVPVNITTGISEPPVQILPISPYYPPWQLYNPCWCPYFPYYYPYDPYFYPYYYKYGYCCCVIKFKYIPKSYWISQWGGRETQDFIYLRAKNGYITVNEWGSIYASYYLEDGSKFRVHSIGDNVFALETWWGAFLTADRYGYIGAWSRTIEDDSKLIFRITSWYPPKREYTSNVAEIADVINTFTKLAEESQASGDISAGSAGSGVSRPSLPNGFSDEDVDKLSISPPYYIPEPVITIQSIYGNYLNVDSQGTVSATSVQITSDTIFYGDYSYDYPIPIPIPKPIPL